MSDLESVCKQCGLCCHGAVDVSDPKTNKNVRYWLRSVYCKFLNVKTGTCKDYENRFDLGVGCLSIKEALYLGHAPNTCAYIEPFKIDRDTCTKYVPLEVERQLIMSHLDLFIDDRVVLDTTVLKDWDVLNRIEDSLNIL